jgi:hypothetical protein
MDPNFVLKEGESGFGPYWDSKQKILIDKNK